MSPTKKPKADEPTDPDKLSRVSAGNYRSGDGRFEVRQSNTAWYLVDLERTNDFGQELIHGPFATLKVVGEALAGARKVTPLARPKVTAAAKRHTEAKTPPTPPATWIDRLPDDDAALVRRLIRALERDGVADAEEWVKESRSAGARLLAERLIEHRLGRIADDADAEDRRRARELIRRVAHALAQDGAMSPPPLPRWSLVEVDPGDDPPTRRLELKF